MICNIICNVVLVLMSVVVLLVCVIGGFYVQSDQYGNLIEQQNWIGCNVLIGIVIGVVVGLLIGDSVIEWCQYVLIGVGIGVFSGVVVGQYQDCQECVLCECIVNIGIDVQCQGDNIMLNFLDGIIFDFGKVILKLQFYGLFNGVVGMLWEYNQIMIEVVGYIDSIGSDVVNNCLLKECVDLVVQYLIGQGVQSVCIEILGVGKVYLIVDNSIDVGCVKNCCVEIWVILFKQ